MSKNSKIKMIVAFFVLLMLFLIINKSITKRSNDKDIKMQTSLLFEKINKSSVAKIDKYIIYGTHLNLEGTIQIPKISGISVYSPIKKNPELITSLYLPYFVPFPWGSKYLTSPI